MLQKFADVVTYGLFALDPASKLGAAVNFFIYDSLKIFMLLAGIIFIVSIIRSYFSPETVRRMLCRRNEGLGNVLAALLGIVTPFCSCSAVPLFIGFIEAGVPLGVTFSFLISSPMVNEVAVVLLWGMFGWKIAGFYLVTGLSIAIVSGYIIGRLRLEHLVEEYVYQIKSGESQNLPEMSWGERLNFAGNYTQEILKKVWPYVLVAIGIGGIIHGYAPENFLVEYAGKDNIWAVPIAVAIGVPLYSNAAGIIPIVYALMEKGMSLGTVLAFMMSVTALSLPEMIILRNVLKPKLIGVFVGVVAISIIMLGYLFNAVLA